MSVYLWRTCKQVAPAPRLQAPIVASGSLSSTPSCKYDLRPYVTILVVPPTTGPCKYLPKCNVPCSLQWSTSLCRGWRASDGTVTDCKWKNTLVHPRHLRLVDPPPSDARLTYHSICYICNDKEQSGAVSASAGAFFNSILV